MFYRRITPSLFVLSLIKSTVSQAASKKDYMLIVVRGGSPNQLII
ncbi:exported protein of unknown function [Legionella pneumophila subsp. pneumophila]|uniref:Uncharacterized protein n=1 Tax=Legionella pneumophila subsp. pneumophila TaxID=91891 RepID=A0AAV2UZD3_LEGPN|nr:exported protein of unknown function [Legionella pneumophila subsp. pneumophila]